MVLFKLAIQFFQNSLRFLFDLAMFGSIVKSLVHLLSILVSGFIVISNQKETLRRRIDRLGILFISNLLELKLLTSDNILDQFFCYCIIQILETCKLIRNTRFERANLYLFVFIRVDLKIYQVFSFTLRDYVNKVHINTRICSTATYTLISHPFVQQSAHCRLVNLELLIISFQMEQIV